MTLLWCLCVGLVLTGLVFLHTFRAALQEMYLSWFGVRVRVRACHPVSAPDRPVVGPTHHHDKEDLPRDQSPRGSRRGLPGSIEGEKPINPSSHARHRRRAIMRVF